MPRSAGWRGRPSRAKRPCSVSSSGDSCAAAETRHPSATCSPCRAARGPSSRSRLWLTRCSAPEQGRLVPAAAIARPLSSSPLARISWLSRERRSARSSTGRAALPAIMAEKASKRSSPASSASCQSSAAVRLLARSPAPARSVRGGAEPMTPMSTTMPLGIAAANELRVPSAITSDATGELMPSCAIVVGMLRKSVPVRAAASLAVSIALPPPTATTSETPSWMTSAARSAAWSNRPASPSRSTTSTVALRRPSATRLAEAPDGPHPLPTRTRVVSNPWPARSPAMPSRQSSPTCSRRGIAIVRAFIAAASVTRATAASWSRSSSISTQRLSGVPQVCQRAPWLAVRATACSYQASAAAGACSKLSSARRI